MVRHGYLQVGVFSLALVAVPSLGSDPELPEPAHSQCTTCHSAGDATADRDSPPPDSEGPTIVSCVSCHRDIEQPTAGPAADRDTDTSGHVRQNERTLSGFAPGGGGPMQLDCLSCHSPHANGQPYQLRYTAEDLLTRHDGILDAVSRTCLSCHAVFGKTGMAGHHTRHPMGIAARRGRLESTADVDLPLTDIAGTESPADDVISCLTCHVVHAGRHRFALRWPQGEMREACSMCHDVGYGSSKVRGLNARGRD